MRRSAWIFPPSELSLFVETYGELTVDTKNWHDEDFLDNLARSVRPLIETGQTGLEKFVKLQIGLHQCVDLVDMIEMHI